MWPPEPKEILAYSDDSVPLHQPPPVRAELVSGIEKREKLP